MSGAPNGFNFFGPVLSTDIVNVVPVVQAPIQDPNKPIQNPITRKKERKKPKIENKPAPESQEEIDAWIAERKKRFPTKQKIAQKEMDQQNRKERGALDLSEPNKPKKAGKTSAPVKMSSAEPTRIPSFLDELTKDQEKLDHSIILQCFRYFVTHDFLQKQEKH